MAEGDPVNSAQIIAEINSFYIERAESRWIDVAVYGDPEIDDSEKKIEISKGLVTVDLIVGSKDTTLCWRGEPPEEFIPGGGRPGLETHLKIHNTITHALPRKLFPTTHDRSAGDYMRAYRSYSKVEVDFSSGEQKEHLLRDHRTVARLADDVIHDSGEIESLIITGSELPDGNFGYILIIDYIGDGEDERDADMRLIIQNNKYKAWTQDALRWVLDTVAMKETLGDLDKSAEGLSRLIIPKIEAHTKAT